jgi:uncharacterized protein YaaN involved in tellurite resistance
MSETTAPTTTSEIKPTAPLPESQVPVYAQTTDTVRAEIDRVIGELDLEESNSILMFGTSAQTEVTTIADEMLEGVRNKDTGPAGEALNEMVSTLRGFSVDELAPGKKPGFFARLLGRAKPIARVLQQYEQVRAQIDAISNRLDDHTNDLMRDVAMLDRLYDKTLDYFQMLALYIAAGEEWLRRLDSETLPALSEEAGRSEDILKAQELRDLRAKRDDLERRVHDLKLTRQVTMQSLPSVRLVQENDKALVSKIGSTMANTIPLWRQQLAMAVTIARSVEAGKTLKDATDLTNELLTANADALQTSTASIRQQVERGIVDIEAVKQANDSLIATIDDALRYAEEGKQQRQAAETQLVACEAELKEALVAAKSKVPPAQPPGSSI